MPCPHVDNSHSAYNGWWCGVTKEHCDRDIVSCYCSASANYKYCPNLGGDDRLRKSTEIPKKKEEPPKRREERRDKPTPAPTPAPTPTPTPKPATVRRSGGGVDLAAIVVVLTVIGTLVVSAFHYGVSSGFLKSKLTVTMDTSNTSIADKDVRIVALAVNEKHKEYSKKLKKDSHSCTLQLPAGEYSLSIVCDGETYSFTNYNMASWPAHEELTYDGSRFEPLMYRAVLFSFVDTNGNPVQPSNLSITDSQGNQTEYITTQNSEYLTFLANDAGQQDLIFRADGYQSETISFNADKYRVHELEVVLLDH